MKPDESDILLSRALLRFHQASGAIYTHDQAARHLGVERAAVSRFFDAEDALDPGHHLVCDRGGVQTAGGG